MVDRGYVQFTVEEAQAGKEFALKTHGFDLDAGFLRYLANHIRARMHYRNESFCVAREYMLNDAKIFAVDPESRKKRDAYKSTFGSMFGKRKKFSKSSSTSKAANDKFPCDKHGQLKLIL